MPKLQISMQISVLFKDNGIQVMQFTAKYMTSKVLSFEN